MKDEPRKQGGGLSLKTLVIAGAASATASLVVPLFWKPGTVFAAAVTPIIVAIAQELLRRPVESVSAVSARRTAGGAVILDPPPERPFDPLAPAPADELEALPQTTTRRTVTRRRTFTARRLRLALLTGAVAFAGAVGVVTASELVTGESVGGGTDNPTTFFGGRSDDRDEKEEATPSPSPSASPTRTPTGTPTPSATPTPTPTPTPAPSATPAPAEPAPQSTPSASPAPAP